MSHQVLARKWRPGVFDALVGQDHVVRALRNALAQERLHHACLFTGTRGVGKTTLARIYARCLNCEEGVTATPCGVCTSCREILEGRGVDLIEIDAASRTRVEDMRELLDNVQYAPVHSRFKIFLIDEVHMLSTSSFNALLKTLEEPPEHVKFLMATTDPQKLPITVLSRCLQFNLRLLTPRQISSYLQQMLEQEDIPCEQEALWQIARAASGSMRDALSLTDQSLAFGNGQLLAQDVADMLGTVEGAELTDILKALSCADGAGLTRAAEQLAERAPDYADVLRQLIELLHHIAREQVLPGSLTEEVPAHGVLRELSGTLSAEAVQVFYQIALLCRRDLTLAPDPAMGFEMALLRMLAFSPCSENGGTSPGKPQGA